MAVGLYLLSLMGVHTSVLRSGMYMFVLGVGLGGVMQVLVIAVQNAVACEDSRAAAAGSTFLPSIGGSLGTAVCAAVCRRLQHQCRQEPARIAPAPRLHGCGGCQPRSLEDAAEGRVRRLHPGVCRPPPLCVPHGGTHRAYGVRPQLASAEN